MLDEDVPTPTGWRKHGDLKPGDQVFGADGKPARVIARTPVFRDADCFRVTFDDGFSTVVSGDHLWTIEYHSKRRITGTSKRIGISRKTVTTRELAGRLPRYCSTPLCAPLQWPEAQLTIDPYILGCWLGDGSSEAAAFVASHEDFPHFEREFQAAGHEVVATYRRKGCLGYRVDSRDAANVCIRGHDKRGAGGYIHPKTGQRHCRQCHQEEQDARLRGGDRSPRVLTLAEKLRNLGLIASGKKTHKFVPSAYLTASAAQRLALLQGLMDTDGHCNTRGTATFVNTNDDLAGAVVELAASLGMKPHRRQHFTQVNGERYPFWHVSFQAYRDQPPFRLPRKVQRCKEGSREQPRRYFRSIEPAASVPVSCIQIDREDGLYVVGRHMAVTHNSTIITFGLTIFDILNDPEVTVGIFSHTRPIAKGFLRQVKREFEANERLKEWFPDILWENPAKQSSKWSEDDGIVVKRQGNPKESTVEAWGLVDGQPTGKHYRIRVYDDIVVPASVTTPEMIAKTTESWELSDNLGTVGGVSRGAGTRYHFNDTYGEMMKRKVVKPRVYPCTKDGTDNFTPENCVLMSPETLADKRRNQGLYTFCLPGDAPILMADFTERPMSEVVVGDAVIGYEFPKRAKARMRPAVVKAIQKQQAEVFEFTLASGRAVRCTANHRWYTGRRGPEVGGTDAHNAYSAIDVVARRGTGGNANHLVSLYDPRELAVPYDERAAAWLSGFFDGEGSSSGGSIHFSQTDRHPVVVERLEECLKACGFDYGVHTLARPRPNWSTRHDYYIRGGRTANIRFLKIVRPAKKEPIIKALLERDARCFNGPKSGAHNRDKVISKVSLGTMDVFNMETETGNYIAYGYASKNSTQMLLDPKGDSSQGFQRSWLRYSEGQPNRSGLNVYILVDPANAKKKRSDFTSMWVIGLGADENYVVLDVLRDKLNLTERADRLFELVNVWKPIEVGYEEYGLQADIQHIQHLQHERNYRFRIKPLGGSMSKEDRIRRLLPLFEQGRVILPPSRYRTLYDKSTVNLIDAFVEEEYVAFPVAQHDDMLDCLARIADVDLKVRFPVSSNSLAGWSRPDVQGLSLPNRRRR